MIKVTMNGHPVVTIDADSIDCYDGKDEGGILALCRDEKIVAVFGEGEWCYAEIVETPDPVKSVSQGFIEERSDE